MIAKIKRLLGMTLFTKPLKKEGPFERAAKEVAEMEAADRARWEERERQWEAKRRCTGGHHERRGALQGDLRIMAEHEKRKKEVKEFKEQRTNREIASGMVIDPGGTCLCRRCGHTVSISYDNCIQCNNKLTLPRP